MQNKIGKPVFAKFDESQGGGAAAVLGSNPADLLTSSDLGVRITGVVLSVEEPKTLSGTSKTGKPFSFTQRRIQIFTGNKSVEVSERLPDPVNGQPVPAFAPLPVLTKQAFRVTSIRPGANGTGINFDVQLQPAN